MRPVLHLALLGGLGLACGSRPGEGALRVLVSWEPEVRAACLKVRVSQDGGVRDSAGLVRDAGPAPLVVAVYEDGLGAEARVQALGFLPDCQTGLTPPEASEVVSGRFGAPEPTELTLRVRVLGPTDGGPPDGGPPDAGPPDGGPPDAGPPCPGLPVDCQAPAPTCRQVQACPDGTCVLRPAPAGTSCDDALACTSLDVCDGDGGCGGAARVCPDPQVACLVGACREPDGCGTAADPLATCTDGDACTENDACLGDGGCAGAPIACPPPGPCQQALGCDGGACRYAARAGACDGGACNALGQCVPPTATFPYLPSNFTEGQLPPLTPAPLTLACAITIDTRTADGGVGFSSACGTPAPSLSVLRQGGGNSPEAALLFSGPLTLEAAGFLTVKGARPLLIVVQGDAALAGLLVAQAGADLDCAPATQGPFDGFTPGGGGGGGFGSAGSGGGVTNRGGRGQGTSGSQLLVPLRGGCSGGLGGPTTAGGAGGGGVQLSATGTVTVDGVVSAPGGGGAGAPLTVRGGGGGGSGGGILLEGVQVAVGHAGAVVANGGGGGEGSDTSPGQAGQPGSVTTSSAPGGTGASTCGGAGGAGGASGGGPESGSPAPQGGCSGGQSFRGGGGGGGGGVGRVRLNAVTGCVLDGVVSPAPTGC